MTTTGPNCRCASPGRRNRPCAPHAPTSRRQRAEAGFTLIELTVVVLIAALLVKIAIANIGALIPTSKMDSVANQLAAWLAERRSEAVLQGKSLKFLIDLDRDMHCEVNPPEDQYLSTALIESEERRMTNWERFDSDVDIVGFAIGSQIPLRTGVVAITFDAHGRTMDSAIFLQHRMEKQLVWTVQVPGLKGELRVIQGGGRGLEHPLIEARESDF